MSGPPINPPNVRYPFALPEELDPEVKRAIEYTYNGLVVHEQAFASLKPQIDSTALVATKASQATVAGVSSFNSETGDVVYFPQLGTVNDQLGNPLYVTQTSDNGAKLIVGDSTPFNVGLNANVTPPWFVIIDNDSTATATLVPTAGSIFGQSFITGGSFGIVAYDGSSFWCGTAPLATDSSFGIVQPDGITIDCDSGMIFTTVLADSGAPTPIFPGPFLGNPFYFDSSVSPWQGYVWFGNAWNKFQ
jgi:hypothetical protein